LPVLRQIIFNGTYILLKASISKLLKWEPCFIESFFYEKLLAFIEEFNQNGGPIQ
jgi:hypothetical protein